MPGTIFEGSNLTGADFSGADITGSDLRRAIIEDIHIASDQLRNVIVTSDQALYLTRLFGLDVRE
ncbi:MAG: pentapeptide repeat-containing protein [Thermomicrobiales bacterium]|nr:pentapeptide repeat-containing protein [Thermomicrobiales bacterium]MCO5228507.1 pentapeptide repeat-containing protein [Thermomicrobiales bacterium]